MSFSSPNDLQQVLGTTRQVRPLNQPGFKGLVVIGTRGSAYSLDGDTWALSNLPDRGANEYATGASNGKVVVIMAIDFAVFRSTDGGITFSQVSADATNGNGGSWSVSPRPYTKQLIYADFLGAFVFTNNVGFGLSYDNGANWSFELWTTNHSAAFQHFWYLEPSNSLGIIAGGGSRPGFNIWTEDGVNWNQEVSADAGSNPQWTYTIWAEELGQFYSIASIWNVNATMAESSADGKNWSRLIFGAKSGSYHSAAFSPTLGSGNGRMIFTRTANYDYSDDAFTITDISASFLGGGGGNKFDLIWSPIFKRYYVPVGNAVLTSETGLTLTWNSTTVAISLASRQIIEVSI